MSLDRVRVLSGSWLKLLAVVSMVADHCAYMFLADHAAAHAPLLVLGHTEISLYFILRRIGRLAFPIFCFLLTEGYLHTKSRRKYGRDLLLFAVLSEIPYNLMLCNTLWYPGRQNIFVTLFLGYLLMWTCDREWGQLRKLAAYLGICAAAALLEVDYGLPGVLLILLMYALRQQTALRTVLAYPLLSGGIAAFAAFLPISLYNGQRGFIRGKWLKYAFYLFYPVHMLVLWAVKTFLSYRRTTTTQKVRRERTYCRLSIAATTTTTRPALLLWFLVKLRLSARSNLSI